MESVSITVKSILMLPCKIANCLIATLPGQSYRIPIIYLTPSCIMCKHLKTITCYNQIYAYQQPQYCK